jgi:hypothetical protein
MLMETPNDLRIGCKRLARRALSCVPLIRRYSRLASENGPEALGGCQSDERSGDEIVLSLGRPL